MESQYKSQVTHDFAPSWLKVPSYQVTGQQPEQLEKKSVARSGSLDHHDSFRPQYISSEHVETPFLFSSSNFNFNNHQVQQQQQRLAQESSFNQLFSNGAGNNLFETLTPRSDHSQLFDFTGNQHEHGLTSFASQNKQPTFKNKVNYSLDEDKLDLLTGSSFNFDSKSQLNPLANQENSNSTFINGIESGQQLNRRSYIRPKAGDHRERDQRRPQSTKHDFKDMADFQNHSIKSGNAFLPFPVSGGINEKSSADLTNNYNVRDSKDDASAYIQHERGNANNSPVTIGSLSGNKSNRHNGVAILSNNGMNRKKVGALIDSNTFNQDFPSLGGVTPKAVQNQASNKINDSPQAKTTESNVNNKTVWDNNTGKSKVLASTVVAPPLTNLTKKVVLTRQSRSSDASASNESLGSKATTDQGHIGGLTSLRSTSLSSSGTLNKNKKLTSTNGLGHVKVLPATLFSTKDPGQTSAMEVLVKNSSKTRTNGSNNRSDLFKSQRSDSTGSKEDLMREDITKSQINKLPLTEKPLVILADVESKTQSTTQTELIYGINKNIIGENDNIGQEHLEDMLKSMTIEQADVFNNPSNEGLMLRRWNYYNGDLDAKNHHSLVRDVNLSSSLEAEQRLLKEMGWKEEDEDESVDPLTEDEVKEFKDRINTRIGGQLMFRPKPVAQILHAMAINANFSNHHQQQQQATRPESNTHSTWSPRKSFPSSVASPTLGKGEDSSSSSEDEDDLMS